MIHAGRRLSDRERAARRGEALTQAERYCGPVAGTGLAKLCSRCERIGWAFERIGSGFVIVWEGRGHRADRPDMSFVTERELTSPDFGCLYCHPVAAGAATDVRHAGASTAEEPPSVL